MGAHVLWNLLNELGKNDKKCFIKSTLKLYYLYIN